MKPNDPLKPNDRKDPPLIPYYYGKLSSAGPFGAIWAEVRLSARPKAGAYWSGFVIRPSTVAPTFARAEFAVPPRSYCGFSFGPNCSAWFNCQRGAQRGQASYVVAVMPPSEFAQLK